MGTGTMGLLAALKAIGAQLLGFKFLFTIFQERTRASLSAPRSTSPLAAVTR